ncbi:MAG: YbjN domain-containing protein [Armatimonadota bacterium]|nr:YbjN domain-containing protein [Armatimonadota bacterium]
MLFSDKQEANLRSCIQMIEETISALGHDPDKSRLETQDLMPAWRVKKGSAHVYVALYSKDGANHLRVTAPVMHLEGEVDRPRLFQRLLELNASDVRGAAFALTGTEIVLTADRPTLDLDRSEVHDLLRRVEDYADSFDDRLVAEFGGRMAGLSTVPVALR